jgi:hypothetical protein
MRRHTIIVLAMLALFAGLALAAGCGSGDTPAIEPGTLYPSASTSASGGATAGPSASPGSPSPSPSAATLTPSPTPTTSGSNGGGDKKISDAKIKAFILSNFSTSPMLMNQRIRVAVSDGAVILKGTVLNDKQKAEAERIAVTAAGVVKVISYLVVNPKGDGGY